MDKPTPKKCALCGCIDEKGQLTCRLCGEATWLPVWVKTEALIEAELKQAQAEQTEQVSVDSPAFAPKPKRGKK